MKILILYILPMAISILVFSTIGISIEISIIDSDFLFYFTRPENSSPHNGYGAVVGILCGLLFNEYFFRAIVIKKLKIVSIEDVKKVMPKF